MIDSDDDAIGSHISARVSPRGHITFSTAAGREALRGCSC